MKYKFKLAAFPGSEFELETSMWTGKSRMIKDNTPVEQSKERGRPFLIPTANNEILKAYPKQKFPDFALVLTINGTEHELVEKLKWFEYAVGGIPIVLLFLGGAIGGIIGAVGLVTNFNIFRQEGAPLIKYLKVTAVIVSCFLLYLAIGLLFQNFVNAI